MKGDDERRDFRVIVSGAPGTFTSLGETETLDPGAEGNPPTSYPTIAMPRTDALVDERGRAVVLRSPLKIPRRPPMRIRDGAPRPAEVSALRWVPTDSIELPAGSVYWLVGRVTEHDDRIEITAARGVLVLSERASRTARDG